MDIKSGDSCLKKIAMQQFLNVTSKERVDEICPPDVNVETTFKDCTAKSTPNLIIKDLATMCKTVFILVHPTEDQLFQTTIPDLIKNDSAVMIVYQKKLYFNTSLLQKNIATSESKGCTAVKSQSLMQEGASGLKQSKKVKSCHFGKLLPLSNRQFQSENKIEEIHTGWRRNEIFVMSQICINNIKSFSKIHDTYDEVRKKSDLILRQKSDEQISNFMSKTNISVTSASGRKRKR